jgi:hypothetical protein
MSPVNGSGLAPLVVGVVASMCRVCLGTVQDPDPIGTISRFGIPKDVCDRRGASCRPRRRSQPAVIVAHGNPSAPGKRVETRDVNQRSPGRAVARVLRRGG